MKISLFDLDLNLGNRNRPGALVKLQQLGPGKRALRIERFLTKCDQELIPYRGVKNRLIQKHESIEGAGIEPGTPQWTAFWQEFEPIATEQVEIDTSGIVITDADIESGDFDGFDLKIFTDLGLRTADPQEAECP